MVQYVPTYVVCTNTYLRPAVCLRRCRQKLGLFNNFRIEMGSVLTQTEASFAFTLIMKHRGEVFLTFFIARKGASPGLRCVETLFIFMLEMKHQNFLIMKHFFKVGGEEFRLSPLACTAAFIVLLKPYFIHYRIETRKEL